MPIPKFVRPPQPPPVPVKNYSQDDSNNGCYCNKFGSWFIKKLLMTFFAILLVYVIFYVGTLIRNNIKQYDFIGKADRMERTITVNGSGKVNGSNDIAMTTIGYSNTDKDVAKAQLDNKKVMDQVFNSLKSLGIADKDLQTNYSVFPEYNYTQDKGQQLTGYRVSNQVSVKIRDLSKIPEILGLAGKYGATEISGLNFTIDDPDSLKAQARDKALIDARSRAVVLVNSLGVKLGGVVAYNEYEGGADYPLPVYSSKAVMGMGGGGAAPEVVAGGSKDVTMNVSVTYEISP